MNGINIRLCEPRDLEAVSLLLKDTWHATYDDIFGVDRVADMTGRWHNTDVLRTNLETEDAVFIVAERDGILLGTAFARTDAATSMIKCDRIYVHPDAQSIGVGYALLGELIVRAGPADRICLEVEPSNKPAIAFYERAGFKVVGKGTDCGGKGDGIEHVIMEREL